MTGPRSSIARLRRTLFGARWAAVYLVAAGALIAAAGSDVSSPSPEEHAREIELRAAAELGTLAEAAAAVADSVSRERARVVAARETKLDAALAAARSWLHASLHTSIDEGLDRDALAASAPDLAPLVPAGVAVAVVGSAGEPLFECGGRVDLDSPEARVEPVDIFGHAAGGRALGLTLAVAWTEPLPEAGPATAAALSSALRAAAPAGTGLYFVGHGGDLAADVAPRPVPAAPLAPSFDGRPLREDDGTPYLASGDLETGKLVAVRRATSMAGWTAVAERFMTPEELAEGAPGGLGMIALTTLGLVAAAAFAHAVRAGVIGSRSGSKEREECDEGPRRGRSPRPFARSAGPAMHPAQAHRPSVGAVERAEAHGEAAPVPTGRSILRLREELGTPAEGPDIAACARSPILRALSRNVRAPKPVALPREVREWGVKVARGAPPAPIQRRKSA
ncbi:MAG: hypothetical protein ACYTKD_16375 [Planctomycetota bacterium]|jgi:hypothetical protein